jgi:hypothetical protein
VAWIIDYCGTDYQYLERESESVKPAPPPLPGQNKENMYSKTLRNTQSLEDTTGVRQQITYHRSSSYISLFTCHAVCILLLLHLIESLTNVFYEYVIINHFFDRNCVVNW